MRSNSPQTGESPVPLPEMLSGFPPRCCHPFTLTGILQTGNALIHVTQTQDKRVVGGISVLAMADEK